MAIVVKGATCSLGQALVDKLLLMDIDVIATEESHKLRNETLLKYSSASLNDSGEGYSVSFDGSSADLEIGNHIVLHDLIPTHQDKWMPDEIKCWCQGSCCRCVQYFPIALSQELWRKLATHLGSKVQP